MKKRKMIILLILLLTIGFASIATRFIIKGNVGILSNLDDYDVYFSEAVLDSEDVSAEVISSNGKNINFSTKELINEGETSILLYKVKNASTQYDAQVSVSCSLENNNEEVNINDYIEFNNSLASSFINAGSEENGTLTVKLKKAVVEKMQTKLNCELVVNAVEKTKESEGVGEGTNNQTYSFSGVLLDDGGNPLANKTLVIYPEPIVYVTTDGNGYVNIPKLSKDHNEIYVFNNDVSIDELKQKDKNEIIASSISNSVIQVNNENITFENGFVATNVEMVENPMPSSTYDLYGYIKNVNDEIIQNGVLVVYSNNPHYASIDDRGYFFISGLEDGSHEVYYLAGNLSNVQTLSKNEVKEQAIGSAYITTSSRKITLSNKYKIDDYIIEKDTNRNYKVTLNANGGNVNSDTIDVVQNKEYGNLPTPTRDGYTFLGWYLGDTKIESNYFVTPDKSHTLEARWSANTYSVSFNSNGGSTVSSVLNVTYDETYGTLPETSRTGYTFDGWYTEQSGGTKIEPSSKVLITSDKTLYAHWNINKYTLTLKKGTGIASVTGSGTYNYGESVTISATVSTGYTWSKWTGTKESSSISFTFNMPASNVTETANATVNKYTLTFDSMGGSSVSSKKVNYDAQYGTLTTPTWSGYTFNGWYTAKSGGTKVTSTTKMAAKNTTIYAQWSKNSVVKGDEALDYGSVKNWIVLSVSGDNIRLVSKNLIGSWTETKEAPATEVSRIDAASKAYVVKNSSGTTIATPSGNLTLSDLNSYNGASYSLNATVSNSLFNSGNYWLSTNCTERYGGPYYVSGGTVKYAYYADGYVDTFSLRPVVTISKSHLKWNSSTKVWTVI